MLVSGDAYYNDITADAGTKFLNNQSALFSGLFSDHEFLYNRLIFSQKHLDILQSIHCAIVFFLLFIVFGSCA